MEGYECVGVHYFNVIFCLGYGGERDVGLQFAAVWYGAVCGEYDVQLLIRTADHGGRMVVRNGEPGLRVELHFA